LNAFVTGLIMQICTWKRRFTILWMERASEFVQLAECTQLITAVSVTPLEC